MSKIDKLVETTARIEEHCRNMNLRLDQHAATMERVDVRVTSLEKTRTFARGMIKMATIIGGILPGAGWLLVKIWKITR